MEDLTPKEKEVLLLLVEGMSNSEISEKLFRTETAIKERLTKLYKKLGVKGRLGAVAKYHKHVAEVATKKALT